jgi:hypothetical protein
MCRVTDVGDSVSWLDVAAPNGADDRELFQEIEDAASPSQSPTFTTKSALFDRLCSALECPLLGQERTSQIKELSTDVQEEKISTVQYRASLSKTNSFLLVSSFTTERRLV